MTEQAARRIAFTAVIRAPDGYGIAIVEQDVAGYALDPSEPRLDTWEAAAARATAKNDAIGVSPREAWEIVASSIGKSNASNTRWSPRGS